ncbi:MAG: YHS domain-containing (seleno)protein [Bacteroidota bacterium]
MKKITLFLLFIATYAHAQKSEVFSSSKGAVEGYDVVAYFTEGKPVEGAKTYTTKWKGEDWFFSSQANRDLFLASPEKYEPQYGGYCAFGMSRGYKAKTDPQAWTILDGKLYLNYNRDVQVEWAKDTKGYIEKANKNWPTVKSN